eukprot:403354462
MGNQFQNCCDQFNSQEPLDVRQSIINCDSKNIRNQLDQMNNDPLIFARIVKNKKGGNNTHKNKLQRQVIEDQSTRQSKYLRSETLKHQLKERLVYQGHQNKSKNSDQEQVSQHADQSQMNKSNISHKKFIQDSLAYRKQISQNLNRDLIDEEDSSSSIGSFDNISLLRHSNNKKREKDAIIQNKVSTFEKNVNKLKLYTEDKPREQKVTQQTKQSQVMKIYGQRTQRLDSRSIQVDKINFSQNKIRGAGVLAQNDSTVIDQIINKEPKSNQKQKSNTTNKNLKRAPTNSTSEDDSNPKRQESKMNLHTYKSGIL